MKSAELSILIVEDELIIAEDLKEKLIGFGYQIVDVTDNYNDALSIISDKKPDLVLLDIQLKGNKTGIDIASEIDKKHHIPYIFLTSNHQPSTLNEIKQLHPSAFLSKPYKKEELYMAIELIFQTARPKYQPHSPAPFIFIKDGHVYRKIHPADVLYLKADGVYIEIKTTGKSFLTRDTFKNLLEKMPREDFIQCHKSYYLQINHIDSVTADEVVVKGESIPLGRTYKTEVLKTLGIQP